MIENINFYNERDCVCLSISYKMKLDGFLLYRIVQTSVIILLSSSIVRYRLLCMNPNIVHVNDFTSFRHIVFIYMIYMLISHHSYILSSIYNMHTYAYGVLSLTYIDIYGLLHHTCNS
jgi:hypothetical protein